MSKELEVKGKLFDWKMNSDTGVTPAVLRVFKVDDIPVLERFFFYIDVKYEHGGWSTFCGCSGYTRELHTDRYQDVFGYTSCIEKINNHGEIMRMIIQPQRNSIYDLYLVTAINNMKTMEISEKDFYKVEKWIKDFTKNKK
jgi:hypothetical protein